MHKLTTKGVTVGVEVGYSQRNSQPSQERYVFGYQITIINESPDPVQLLRRHWRIFDSIGERRDVEGEGVIGEQPTLYPGQLHRYSSWCPLRAEIGQMWGTFLMVNLETKEEFEVKIPAFDLVAPARAN